MAEVEAIISSQVSGDETYPCQISSRIIVQETTQVHVSNNSVVSCL